MSKLVALVASGLAQGAVVALAAIGFLLIYKATGVVNFAQGDLITLGAYVAIWATQDLGLDLLPGYLFTLVVMFGVGMALERVAYAPLRGRSIHVVVIATLGVALVLRAFIGLWQGTTPQFLETPVQGEVFEFAGANIAYQRIVIVVVTALVVVATIAVFQWTQFGRELRATAADRETARLYGVRVTRLSMLAFGISAALAGLAGVLIGPLGSVDLTLGFNVMIGGFAAAIVGGFGSIGGVAVGGIAIGMTEQVLGGYVLRDYKSTFPFVIMILVIALRPQGLFTRGAGQRL